MKSDAGKAITLFVRLDIKGFVCWFFRVISSHGNYPGFTLPSHTSAATCAFKGFRGRADEAAADPC